MGWKFFLPDSYIASVELKIHEIAGSLVERVPGEGGLVGGKAGVACFFAYYADWTGSTEYESLAQDWIEQALNPPAGHFPDLRFSNGLAGIAWLIQHLSETGLIEQDAASVFDELDDYLYDFMISEMKGGHFDYLHGALGIALYFLRQSRNEKYRQYLTELVMQIGQISENGGLDTLRWASPLSDQDTKLVYNLSLSHGMSSIVLILGMILSHGIAVEKCGTLMRGGLSYIEKQKYPPGEYLSSYPSLALESTRSPGPSRLAWCYGDIGTGLAFLKGGKILQENHFLYHGQEVLLKTCKRKDPGENLVYDAGICHGASGLALMYNVLYHDTGLIPFRESALHWLDVTLNMACHTDGIAGYKAWYHEDYGGWKASPGLLDGAAGIGLALLSFVGETPPAWTKALLLN